MKLKKMSRRFLASVLVLGMLFSSATVFAADRPEKNDNPTWGDICAIQEYVAEKTYDRYDNKEIDYVDDVETEKHYCAPGALIMSSQKEQVYCAFIEGSGVYADAWEKDQDTALADGDEKNSYSNFYDAGMAFVDSVTEADGKYYTDDIIGTYDSFWESKDKPFWEKVESGQIITVESEEDAPDVATMNTGTYWMLDSDLEAYSSAIQSATEKSDEWDNKWESNNGRSEVERAEVEQCIKIVTEAYNTLLSKLHEGTKQAAAAANSLTPAESEPVSSGSSSQTKEEAAPVVVNEVAFSSGAKVQSSLKGVYGNNFVAGCIYQGEPAQISQAVGLSEAEMKRGVVVKSYICTSLNKTMNAALSQTVSEQGYKVMGVMNNDLYRLDKGKISKIRTTGEALTVVLGIPENLRNEQYEFVIICYDEDGNLVTMQDTDTDKATITVKSVNFGYWAIGYRTKK